MGEGALEHANGRGCFGACQWARVLWQHRLHKGALATSFAMFAYLTRARRARRPGLAGAEPHPRSTRSTAGASRGQSLTRARRARRPGPRGGRASPALDGRASRGQSLTRARRARRPGPRGGRASPALDGRASRERCERCASDARAMRERSEAAPLDARAEPSGKVKRRRSREAV